MKSKIASVIVGVYLLITIAVVIYATTCRGMYCGFVLAGPILPWPFILEGVLGDSYVLYACLVAFNGLILYLIGLALSRAFEAIKGRVK